MYHFAKGKLILHLRYDFKSDDNCDTIGKTLRYYRLHRGYSTRELAEKVGAVPTTITLYENDKHPIKYKTAILLAEVLGIDRKLLFDEYAICFCERCGNGYHLINRKWRRKLVLLKALILLGKEPPEHHAGRNMKR